MFFGVAFGVSSGKRMGIPVATIVLSNSTIAEDAALGAAVGTLSVINATGTPAFTLVDSAGSRFALSGANVQRGATALDYEAATSHNIIVSVTGMTPSPANATLNIQVTNIAEVPVISVAPTLSPTSGAVGTLITCGTGSWTLSPTSYAYQWMRTGVDISGATSSTYTSVLADDTFTLTCKVLASNADGPAAGYSTTSNSHAAGSVALALDGLTVGVAFSHRKLLTAYAGNGCRIRRSSDNAEQDFGFVGNVIDTAGIATFIGGGTGYAVSWYDQGGGTQTITNATAAQQPIYDAAGLGSKPSFHNLPVSVRSLSRASVAHTSVFSANQGNFIFVLSQAVIYSGGLFELTLTGAVGLAPYDGVLYTDWGNTTTGRVNPGVPGGWYTGGHVLELRKTTTDMYLLSDGTQLATRANAIALSGSGTFQIFIQNGVVFNGHIAEVITLKTEPGTTALATLRSNIGSYYGITVA